MSKIEQALKKVSRDRLETSRVMVDVPDKKVGPGSSNNSKGLDRRNEGAVLLDVQPLSIADRMLVAAHENGSVASEEYNKLRSTIIALTRGEVFLNTLLVTSTASDEGKTITALNLAISLAKEQDHTVLLVDADLRRPSIHKYLDIEPEFGLVNCLRDGLPVESALVKTGIGKLVLLPAGESVKDPLDMLSSMRMREIVEELKSRYSERYVIFDTPPAQIFSDAVVLADMVDSTLFVVRENRASKADIQKVLENFKKHNLLGVVYNDSNTYLKKQNYYYYD